MEDQTTYPFWFKITPIEIKSSQSQRSSKPDTKKSVLIKLGTKEGKTKELNRPIQLLVDILYSKTLNKFCPIKGIIKIYDINPDGSEMISCVGSFNTEELINRTEPEVVVERDIGHYKVKMKISVKQMKKNDEEEDEDGQKLEEPMIINSKTEIASPKKAKDSFTSNLRNGEGSRAGSKFVRGAQRISEELQCQETPYIMDDSMDIEEQASYSEFSEDMGKNERDMLGEQLLEERRNNKILEQRLDKANMKITLLKKNLAQKNAEIKAYINQFKDFTRNLESDIHGQYIFQINERRRELSLKYRQNAQFKEDFTLFLNFMTKKIQEVGSPASSIQNIGIQRANSDMEESSNKLWKKIQQEESQRQRMMEDNKKLAIQVTRLKNQLKHLEHQRNKQKSKLRELKSSEKNNSHSKDKLAVNNQSAANRELQFTLAKKGDEILVLESKLKKLNEEKKSLEGMNQYLQEKDTHMESIINSKENTIQNLKRMINDSTAELDILEEKNNNLEKIVNNFELTIEEMKEQNANLLQTIDEYRYKYGDLKAAKDKALERQLRDCLRWIDQQNRDEELSLEENTMSFTDTTHNVTSIMKGIDQIQNMPLEEISIIRKQVINVLKKLDELLAGDPTSC